MKKFTKKCMSIALTFALIAGLFMINSSQSEAVTVAYSYDVYNCNSYVTLRKSPSTSAKAITTIPYARTVTRYTNYNNGRAKNGFYKVQYGKKTGYVLAKYLGIVYRAKVVKCNSYITLRSSSSTSARALKRIPKGATIYYEKNTSNGFCRVNYNGKLGYVLKKYVKVYSYL